MWEITGVAVSYFLPVLFNEWRFTLIGNYVYMFVSEMIVFLLFSLLFWKCVKLRDEPCGSYVAGHAWIFLPVLLQIFIDFCTLASGDVDAILPQEQILFLPACFLGTMAIRPIALIIVPMRKKGMVLHFSWSGTDVPARRRAEGSRLSFQNSRKAGCPLLSVSFVFCLRYS